MTNKIMFMQKANFLRFLLIVLLMFLITSPRILQAQMTNFGNLYLHPAATIQVNGSFTNANASGNMTNTGKFYITGDFTNNGNSVVGSATSVIYFIGTGLQVINGSQTSEFYRMELNNPVRLQLQNNLRLAGDLVLTDGIFSLNDYQLNLAGGLSRTPTGRFSSTPSSRMIIESGPAHNLYFEAGEDSIRDLEVRSGAPNVNLGSSLYIAGGSNYGKLKVDGVFNTNNNLTLVSNVDGTAMIAASQGTINGNVSVERFIATGTGTAPNHGKSWQLLAVPTTGQTIKQAWMEGATLTNISSPASGSAGNPKAGYGTMLTSGLSNAVALGFDAYTSPGPSLKIYNPVSNNYDGPASANDPLYNKNGYFVFVRGDRSVYTSSAAATPTILRTKGVLFTAGNLPPQVIIPANLFQSVGNPYAAPLDMRNIVKGGGTQDFFQVWDPRLGGSYNYGGFQTFYRSGADFVNLVSSSTYGPAGTINNFIQSGQAFFVQATGSSGTVDFNENSKAANAPSGCLFTRTNTSVNRVNDAVNSLRTSLFSSLAGDSQSVVLDVALNEFAETYSNDIDADDARKPMNSGENLAIKSNETLLVIERKHTISTSDTIFFSLKNMRLGNYNFQFDAQQILATEAFLEDSYTNTRTNINLDGNTNVSFTIEQAAASYNEDRFRIVFKAMAVVPVTFVNIKAVKNNNRVDVQWDVANETDVLFYEIQKSSDGIYFSGIGKELNVLNNSGTNTYMGSDVKPFMENNFYRIKMNKTDGAVIYSKVVKVSGENIEQEIRIYPNPVVNGVINLEMPGQASGMYGIKLYNQHGQLLYSSDIKHDISSDKEQIFWNSVSHAVYKLTISFKGRKIKELSVIY